ncbi:hypothetical protein MLD38_011331 [Melastoma candidum]|uniref:Uncharacterized protein n=1 Tax=Melastoma candidum TaxID=119954 RepID=A0ACB9R680_9MYRT|nr:hypothetical protein MLD38_011331 [Melastoma candidum]
MVISQIKKRAKEEEEGCLLYKVMQMASANSAGGFFGMVVGDQESRQNQMLVQQQQQQPQSSSTTSSTGPTPAQQKKRRNQPGLPNPDTEIIALSPKSLMATNRFICEVCNKGFQREQNLQLHRRGHNLPWKLRQKTTKEVKRKVYLCPEPSCVHHDASRALGDLTGIKKHFYRKHGEKKWKCEKCSKRYAVQSDWKAHSKICGTREYRCDCGTLFSRRDSFITHRAFCDALARESARHPSSLTALGSASLFGGNNNINLGLSQIPNFIQPHHGGHNMLRVGGESHSAAGSSSFLPPQIPQTFFKLEASDQPLQDQYNPLTGLMQLPGLQGGNPSASASSSTNLFNMGFFGNNPSVAGENTTGTNFPSAAFLGNAPAQFGSGNGQGVGVGGLFSDDRGGARGFSGLFNSSAQNESIVSHMSATALLQKAAQMGSITSGPSSTLLGGLGSSSSSRVGGGSFGGEFPAGGGTGGSGGGGGVGGKFPSQMENDDHLRGLFNSLTGGNATMFSSGNENETASFAGFADGGNFSLDQASGMGFGSVNEPKLHHNLVAGIRNGSDKLTLDFLGVGRMMRKKQTSEQLGTSMGPIKGDKNTGSGSGGKSDQQGSQALGNDSGKMR